MNAFLTGSRVYGSPAPDSDIDIAVLLSHGEIAQLLNLSKQNEEVSETPGATCSIRFGNLNIIATHIETEFAAWLIATRDLEKVKPVPKEDCCKHFDKVRHQRTVELSQPQLPPQIGYDPFAD